MSGRVGSQSGITHESLLAYGMRTAYTHAQRQALSALAESNPTPEHYRQERERILALEPS